MFGVLSGENQVEFTINPSVAFYVRKIHFAPADGLLAADVLATTQVFDAHFLQPAAGPVACDQPFDLLYGVTGSIGSVLDPVENPYNSIDGTPATFATLNASLSAVDHRTLLTAIFHYPDQAGDSRSEESRVGQECLS